MKKLLIAAVAAIAIPAAALAHSDHESTAFGEPGDPKAPSRTVEIVMKETSDGKMLFEPLSVTAKKGEQIRFVLKNEGRLTHEFMLATRADNDKHAIAMRKNPDMEHDDPNGRTILAGKTDQIVWKFSKSGDFNFACLIPGHREAGMDGSVAVK
ncbi:plastocyanin/azurin family copper-binding protein [Hansschlegelia quercus]|uniref:Copper resistance protein n=1 Tax=Hansschlegelia quercus TaxID=2528245 RepID=A0A4Q9GHT1_9HYPH|nr:cupredoxin family protein [Hansschlegelia quercus]TBN53622.1 copper resistance protein [Hansschlegelia quercus]